MSQRPNQPWRGASAAAPPQSIPTPDEDVIPTAIVIKNIPFAVSRETLLGIIESLGAPLPYAFNYHHDNGVFRGLAFANFRAPDEAASVVAALNGYDVQGRKLRVEYKKVLQPGEKDRIEREKAIKRMKSMQIEKMPIDIQSPPPLPRSATSNATSSNNNGHHPSFSFDTDDRSPPPSAGSGGSSEPLPNTLDLNDPNSLRIYNMVYMFKEDRMRDELVLSRNLNATERRIVHLVAQKLDLRSVTQGEGDGKHVVVTKDAPPRSAHTPQATSYLSPYPTDHAMPSLRNKKSMPDLRGFNGPVVARDPARSLTPQRSSGNLRAEAADGVVAGRDYASMGAAHGRRLNLNVHGLGSGTFNSFFGASVGAPPLPPLPHSLGDNGDASSQPLRNPRGPVGESRGFMRPVSSSLRGVPGALALGHRLTEEDEDSARSRETLDL
jgi:RNA recognition motif-containing protein